jgi:hypothetical protein
VSQWVSVYVYNHRVLVRSAPRAAAWKEKGGE